MAYHYFELENGIRSVLRPTGSPVSHVDLITGAGSRDEEKKEHGLAHFIEHMVFKGTEHRKSWHILNYIDSVGGELNAFTTREETCLHASVPAEFTERTLDLLSDVFAHSVFPEKEIPREKEVVIDEILYYRDMPDETILDEFEEHLFKSHPLGRCVQGSPESVAALSKNDIFNYIRRNYAAQTTVISCAGGISPEKWQRLLQKHFGPIDVPRKRKKRIVFSGHHPFNKSLTKPIHQSHAVIGGQAYPFGDTRRIGLVLLNNILGGPGNNSRLNLEVRERHGLSYNIESHYNPYSDTGVFLVYLGADTKNLEKAVDLVHKELQKIRSEKLSSLQLHRAKQQLCGQLTIGHESQLGEMLSMGKSTLIRDNVYSLEEAIADIQQLDALDLLHIANDIFSQNALCQLIYRSDK
jgi:predicted Zn-dependent peptidase